MKHHLFKLLDKLGSRSVIAIPYFWLVVFLFLPFIFVFIQSILYVGDSPTPLIDWVSFNNGKLTFATLDFSHYTTLLTDSYYLMIFLKSVFYAFLTMALCLIIGYPFAYFMAKASPSLRPLLLMLVMMPFWTSFLLRIYAWKGLLSVKGVVHTVLMALGLVDDSAQLLNTQFSMLLGMVYVYLPFMVLPLFSTLVKMDIRFIEAAKDLGATPWKAFWLVTVPLSKSGIIAGCMLVFIPCVGEFVIPTLLGGPDTYLIGRALWDEFFGNNNWSRASALTILLLILVLAPLAVFNKYQQRAAR